MTTAVPPQVGVAARRDFHLTWVLAAALVAELVVTVLLVHGPPGFVVVATVLLTAVALIAAAHFALPAAERDPLLILFGAGLGVRLLIMFIWHYAAIAPGNPYGLGARDSFGYDALGWLVAQHWRHGQPPRIEFQAVGLTLGYHLTVAGIYTVVGHIPLLVKTLNVILSASLIPLTFVAGRELAGRRAGLTAAFLIAFWPPVVYWSVHILKDTAITFLLLLAALGWLCFARRPRLGMLVVAFAPAIPLAFLRAYALAFWCAGVAAGLVVLALSSRRILPAIALILLTTAAGLWMATPEGGRWLGMNEGLVAKLSAMGGSTNSVFEHVTYTSVRDILVFIPLGFARFLVTPLPWKVGPPDLAEAAGAVLRYALLPFAAAGLLYVLRVKRAAVLPIVVSASLTFALYSIAFRGGIPRHWMQFYPYFLIFAAAGLPRWPNWPLPMALGGVAFLVSAIAVTGR